MIGEYLTAFNARLIKHYDAETIEQHQTFIVNRMGKPQAAANTHDDAVMASAGVWQLYQSETIQTDNTFLPTENLFDEAGFYV